MNVFTEPDLKKAADSLNASAPEGERLAYVNPEEESMLLGAGGAGVPVNESGVPSYFAFLPFLGKALLSAGVGAGVGKLLGGGGGGGQPTYAQQMQYLMETDPERARMMYERATGGGEYAGISDVDLTRAQLENQPELARLMYQQKLAEMEEYGPQFISQQRELDRLSEPELWARQQEYFADPYGGGPSPTDIYGEGPELSEIADYEGMELGDLGGTPEGRAMLESDVFDQLALGDRFTGEQERMLEQDLLRRLGGQGSAMLGGAPALREAQAKMEARGGLGRQRRGEALGLLASGQSVGDTARRDAAMRADDSYRKFQTNMQKGATQFGQQGARLAGQMAATQAEANRGAGFAGMQQVGGQMPFMTPQMQQVGNPGFMGPAASAYGTAMGGYNAAQARPGIGSLLGTLGGNLLGTEKGAGYLGKFGSWLTGGGNRRVDNFAPGNISGSWTGDL